MSTKDRLIRHALICFAIFFVITAIAALSPRVHIGFFGCAALLFAGTFFTTIGVSAGDAVRRFVMPDAYFVSDVMDSFNKKVFWAIGPQSIGWFIGLMATNGFMKNVLGYTNLF